MIGRTVSHYKIIEKLGEGGMGVVYKAEDSKLERAVALKFLASHLVQDAELRKRFEREAKAAASLDHPNICTVYEIDEAEGKTFISMALLEGESLDQRIERGPLKIAEAVDIALQIAKGLEAAHEKGVVHRDVKPANVMVDAKGHVTVMDFGLALLTEGSKLTRLDQTVGTVAYMSPEQAQGMDVDRRADVWALGCVVYEMISGQRPFMGVYDQALLYEIVNQQPEPLTGLRTGVPVELEFIVDKCLAKDAGQRYQATADLIVDLETLREKLKSGRSTILKTAAQAQPHPQPVGAQRAAPAPAAPTAPGDLIPKRKLHLALALAAGLAIAFAAVSFLYFSQAPIERPLYSFTVPLPERGRLHTLSLSPDGRHLALAMTAAGGARSLWVRSLETQDLRELPGTDGATYPFWSPDSRYIGFFADGKLKKIALSGGPPQSLCAAEDGRGGSWSREGVIVFSPSLFREIHSVAEGGGEPVAITRDDESESAIMRRFPRLLPDGRHFLYLDRGSEEQTGIYLGSLAGGEPRRLFRDDSNAAYTTAADGERGFILFVREGALMAQSFDAESLGFTGDAFPVAAEVGPAVNLSYYAFSASAAGSLVYRSGSSRGVVSQL